MLSRLLAILALPAIGSAAGAILVAIPSALFGSETGPEWSRFRGPGGLGTSPETDLPTTWSQEENIAWKAELPGPGTSSPIVFGDRIFLTAYSGYSPTGAEGDQEGLELHVACFGLRDGRALWRKTVKPKLPEQTKIREVHGYASSTPVADAERVYVFFGKTGVIAYDLEGREQWRADVGSGLSGWGSAASPILSGDLLVVNASVESESLVALEKRTGRERWKARGIKESWNTPILVPAGSGKPELVLAIGGKVLGFDPATGEGLWSCDTDIPWYMVPSPVKEDGVVYSIGGRSGGGTLAVRVGGRGDVTRSHRLWKVDKGSNVSSPIYHQGHLDYMSDTIGVAYCIDAATGVTVYEARIERAGQVYASPVLVGDRIFYVARDGRTFVVAAAPEFRLLATNDLRDGGTFNASPAVAGGRLLLRSDRFLYAIGKAGGEESGKAGGRETAETRAPGSS